MVKKKNKRSNNKRKKDKHKQNIASNPHFGGLNWMDKEGLHAILPGEAPSEEFFELWTEKFQKELRNSLWIKGYRYWPGTMDTKSFKYSTLSIAEKNLMAATKGRVDFNNFVSLMTNLKFRTLLFSPKSITFENIRKIL